MQNKITKSARNQDCTLRIPSVCNFNNETTVLCHKNGGGMGIKHSPIHSCYGCSSCHDWLDNRSGVVDSKTRDCEFLRAMIETQSILIQKNLIQVK